MLYQSPRGGVGEGDGPPGGLRCSACVCTRALGLGRHWPLAVWPEFQWDTHGQLRIDGQLSIMHLFRVAWEAINWACSP